LSGPSGVIRSGAPNRSSCGASGAGRAAHSLRPVLSAERDQVGEALGGDERCLRTTALEQRVGSDGHAVRELFDVRGARAGLVQGRVDRRRHAFGLVLGRGRGLRGDQSAVERENGVGERPAHVDADQHGAST
jgi:hypothetical protein